MSRRIISATLTAVCLAALALASAEHASAATPSAAAPKTTAAAPEGDCPIFQRVLERVIPDADVRKYFQRLIGYCLTGIVREHMVVLVYGSGDLTPYLVPGISS